MKTWRALTALLLCAVVLLTGVQQGMAAIKNSAATKNKPTPGVEAARTLSIVTGVAISPLLGVGAVGAYTWWNTPEQDRARLEWYAQPWFWVPALLLVLFVGVKDILGTAAPTALKKPFDVAETVENKVSGLVAAGAFLPLIISVFPEAAGGGPEALNYSPLSAGGFAALEAGSIANALLVPFALAIFFVVWLASHAINILILLSPFTTLDTALKALRLGLLGLVAGTAFINPYVGAAASVVLIAIAYFIAGWSFRLTVLGSVYVWDFLTFRRHRFQPGTERNRMFTAKPMEDAPVRTYGRLLRRENGGIEFEYRPWLILARKRFVLPKGDYAVGSGLLYPEIGVIEGDRLQTRFLLPPRYCGHEEALARAYGFGPVQDVGMKKGFKMAWRWLKGLFKGEPMPQPVEQHPHPVI